MPLSGSRRPVGTRRLPFLCWANFAGPRLLRSPPQHRDRRRASPSSFRFPSRSTTRCVIGRRTHEPAGAWRGALRVRSQTTSSGPISAVGGRGPCTSVEASGGYLRSLPPRLSTGLPLKPAACMSLLRDRHPQPRGTHREGRRPPRARHGLTMSRTLSAAGFRHSHRTRRQPRIIECRMACMCSSRSSSPRASVVNRYSALARRSPRLIAG